MDAQNGLVESIRAKCVGYYYGADFHSFGSDSLQKLIPYSYVDNIQPLREVEAFFRKLHPFRENKFRYVTEKQDKKRSEFHKKNLDTIIVYHVPLDVAQLVREFRFDAALEKDLQVRKTDYHSETKPQFADSNDYAKAIREAFISPFLIHHRAYAPPTWIRGYQTGLLIIGEIENTAILSEKMLQDPENFRTIVADLFRIQNNELKREFKDKRRLLHFDVTRRPKKTIKLF